MSNDRSRRLSDIMTQGQDDGKGKSEKSVPQANRKEMEERIGAVFDLLVKGKRRAEICAIAAEKWGVSERSAERYITKANRLFEEQAAFRREMVFGKALARIDSLYAAMVAGGDHRGALQAVKEEADLLGLRIIRTAATDTQGRDLINSPQWVELRAILIQVLGNFPDAQQAVLAAIEERTQNTGDD